MVEKIYHLVVQLSKSMKDFGLKEFLKPLLNSMRSFNEYNVKKSLELLFSDSVNIKMCHPFGILNDSESFFHTAYRPLLSALPDLERRDYIVISGTTEKNYSWVGTCGVYCGTFVNPFLDIRLTVSILRGVVTFNLPFSLSNTLHIKSSPFFNFII